MKLSTRCRYGLHAMADLAQHYGQGPQSLREIAERQEVSEMFLEQIFGAARRKAVPKPAPNHRVVRSGTCFPSRNSVLNVIASSNLRRSKPV